KTGRQASLVAPAACLFICVYLCSSVANCLSGGAQELGQEVVLRVAVAEVLAEALGVGDAGLPAAAGTPVAPRGEGGGHAGGREQPLALAGVRRQHLGLGGDDRAHVDTEGRLHVAAQRVLALHGVAVVEVRDVVQGRRVAAAGAEVRGGRAEGGGPHQGAG